MVREVVILAAGEGKRMRRNTSDHVLLTTPKPLLELNGKSIIERKIEKLIKSDFKIIIVVNNKDKGKFLEKLSKYNIVYCTQGDDKGTAAALFAARDYITDDFFLVLMGDDLYDMDWDGLKDDNTPTVFGFEVTDVSNYGVLITDKYGYVNEILEKQRSGVGVANTGSYIMPKAFFDIYKDIPVDKNSGEKFLTHAVKVLGERGFRFIERKLSFWFGINTPEQLREAETLIVKIKRLK